MLINLVSRLNISNNSVKGLTNLQQIRNAFYNKPTRKRNPVWFIRKDLKRCDEHITKENREFVKEVVEDTLGAMDKNGKEILSSKYFTPLKGDIVEKTEWQPKSVRCGLIARKLGVYPMWSKTGKRFATTLLQILDNQVIKHYKADEYQPVKKPVKIIKNKRDCLLLGAEGTDPTHLTKEYCGLFKEAGVMPKAILFRFFVTPDCVLPVGTCLNVMHFRVGDHVDIAGTTKNRGFQGVMKRWGFKGMPATHGVTKTHRRPGNIGGGGEKGRVWPGKKLPGHMGNRYRIHRGLKILRINPKYNVMWIKGQSIQGANNSICFIYDTLLPMKRPKNLHCPTFIVDDANPQYDLENEIYDREIHNFADPTITYEIETIKKTKKKRNKKKRKNKN